MVTVTVRIVEVRIVATVVPQCQQALVIMAAVRDGDDGDSSGQGWWR